MKKQSNKLGAEKDRKNEYMSIKFSNRCYCLCKLGPQYVHVLLYMMDLSVYVIYVKY